MNKDFLSLLTQRWETIYNLEKDISLIPHSESWERLKEWYNPCIFCTVKEIQLKEKEFQCQKKWFAMLSRVGKVSGGGILGEEVWSFCNKIMKDSPLPWERFMAIEVLLELSGDVEWEEVVNKLNSLEDTAIREAILWSILKYNYPVPKDFPFQKFKGSFLEEYLVEQIKLKNRWDGDFSTASEVFTGLLAVFHKRGKALEIYWSELINKQDFYSYFLFEQFLAKEDFFLSSFWEKIKVFTRWEDKLIAEKLEKELIEQQNELQNKLLDKLKEPLALLLTKPYLKEYFNIFYPVLVKQTPTPLMLDILERFIKINEEKGNSIDFWLELCLNKWWDKLFVSLSNAYKNHFSPYSKRVISICSRIAVELEEEAPKLDKLFHSLIYVLSQSFIWEESKEEANVFSDFDRLLIDFLEHLDKTSIPMSEEGIKDYIKLVDELYYSALGLKEKLKAEEWKVIEKLKEDIKECQLFTLEDTFLAHQEVLANFIEQKWLINHSQKGQFNLYYFYQILKQLTQIKFAIQDHIFLQSLRRVTAEIELSFADQMKTFISKIEEAKISLDVVERTLRNYINFINAQDLSKIKLRADEPSHFVSNFMIKSYIDKDSEVKELETSLFRELIFLYQNFIEEVVRENIRLNRIFAKPLLTYEDIIPVFLEELSKLTTETSQQIHLEQKKGLDELIKDCMNLFRPLTEVMNISFTLEGISSLFFLEFWQGIVNKRDIKDLQGITSLTESQCELLSFLGDAESPAILKEILMSEAFWCNLSLSPWKQLIKVAEKSLQVVEKLRGAKNRLWQDGGSILNYWSRLGIYSDFFLLYHPKEKISYTRDWRVKLTEVFLPVGEKIEKFLLTPTFKFDIRLSLIDSIIIQLKEAVEGIENNLFACLCKNILEDLSLSFKLAHKRVSLIISALERQEEKVLIELKEKAPVSPQTRWHLGVKLLKNFNINGALSFLGEFLGRGEKTLLKLFYSPSWVFLFLSIPFLGAILSERIGIFLWSIYITIVTILFLAFLFITFKYGIEKLNQHYINELKHWETGKKKHIRRKKIRNLRDFIKFLLTEDYLVKFRFQVVNMISLLLSFIIKDAELLLEWIKKVAVLFNLELSIILLPVLFLFTFWRTAWEAGLFAGGKFLFFLVAVVFLVAFYSFYSIFSPKLVPKVPRVMQAIAITVFQGFLGSLLVNFWGGGNFCNTFKDEEFLFVKANPVFWHFCPRVLYFQEQVAIFPVIILFFTLIFTFVISLGVILKRDKKL